MSLAVNILESMVVAVFFSPKGFLAISMSGALAIYLGIKGQYIWSVILLAAVGAAMWAISLELSSRCAGCTYVDRIYHMEIRWGLLSWLALFVIALLLMRFRQSYRKQI